MGSFAASLPYLHHKIMALTLPECYGENNRLQVRITTAVEIVKCEISLDANLTITVVTSIPEPHLSCWKFSSSFVFFLVLRFYLTIGISHFGSKQCGHRNSARNYNQQSYYDHTVSEMNSCVHSKSFQKRLAITCTGTILYAVRTSFRIGLVNHFDVRICMKETCGI